MEFVQLDKCCRIRARALDERMFIVDGPPRTILYVALNSNDCVRSQLAPLR